MKSRAKNIITGMLAAGSLLGGGGVEAGVNRSPREGERIERRIEDTNISATEVFQRMIRYGDIKVLENPGRGVEMSDDEDAPENIIARVMMSEEVRSKDNLHLAVLIALTVINRQKISKQDLKTIVTSGKDFGLQSGGRQYSSNYDPVFNKREGVRYRVLAKMVLDHQFDDYDWGQQYFVHVKYQEAMHAQDPKKYKSVAEVIRERLESGHQIITIPGVDPGYIIFFN